MRVPLSKTETYDLKDFVARFYAKRRGKKSFNALFVECRTRHYKTKLLGAVRMYFVVSGSGIFIINNRRYPAERYDFFMLESGDSYEYQGKMKLIEVNIPATDRKNEKKLDK